MNINWNSGSKGRCRAMRDIYSPFTLDAANLSHDAASCIHSAQQNGTP